MLDVTPEVTVESWSCLEVTECSVVVVDVVVDVVIVVVVDVFVDDVVVLECCCDLLIFVSQAGPGVGRAESRVL